MYKKLLLEALNNDSVSKKGLDLKSIQAFIEQLDENDRLRSSFCTRNTQPSFAFSRLRNVIIEPTKLFGKDFVTERAIEYSVYSAKLNSEGEWVEDEDGLILRGLLSESDLTEMIFGRNTGDFVPIKYTYLTGKTPDKIEGELSSEDVLGVHFQKAKNKAVQSIAAIIEESSKFQSSEVKLSKRNKDPILESLHILEAFFSVSDSFALTQDSEFLDKQMLSVKAEVFFTIKDKLLGNALKLEDLKKEEKAVGLFEQQFNTHIDLVGKEAASELMNRYSEVLIEHGDREKRKDLKRYSNWLNSEFNKELSGTSHLSKGCVGLSEVHSTTVKLFGDPRNHNDFFELRFYFAGELISHNSSIKFTDLGQMIEMNYSKTQLMELLQSPFSQKSVRCTIGNVCGEFIDKPTETVNAKMAAIDMAKSVEKPVALISKIQSLQSHLERSGTSKQYRAIIQEHVDDIVRLARIAIPKRETHYKDCQQTLASDYRDEVVQELNGVLGDFESRHPGLLEDVMKKLPLMKEDGA